MSLLILQQSAKTTLRGTEEKCGSPRVRTLSGSRPPLLLRLSENSGDENMSDVTFDSLPSSPSSATPHSQKLDPLRECQGGLVLALATDGRGRAPGRAELNWLSLRVGKSDPRSKRLHGPGGFTGEFRSLMNIRGGGCLHALKTAGETTQNVFSALCETSKTRPGRKVNYIQTSPDGTDRGNPREGAVFRGRSVVERAFAGD